MGIKIWLKAIRAPFFTATIIPVFLGSVIAFSATGLFSWPLFLLVLVGVLFAHMGTNLANDYHDHKTGNDEANQTPTPFSGGSRVIQDGLIPANNIITVSLFSFLITSIIGFYLFFVLGYFILILGIIGVFLGYFYTSGPVRLVYKGVGEIAVGIGFGPLVVIGAYFVQAQSISLNALLISVPIGILIALVLFINEFQDFDPDKKVNKKTAVVRLGKKRSLRLYHFFLVLTYVWVAAGVLTAVFPVHSLLIFLTLPFSVKAMRISKANYEKIYELIPANANTVLLHLTFGSLLIISFFISVFL